jgi:hypothetical protein
MSMNRREFLQILAAASAAGFALDARELLAAQGGPRVDGLYDLPRFGNVHLLHFTDCHAQLLPIHFREPNVNLGIGGMARHGRRTWSARPAQAPSASSRARPRRMPSPTWISRRRRAPTARSAASPTSPRW